MSGNDDVGKFLDEYDLYENIYTQAINIFVKKTGSEKGCICAVRTGSEIVVLSDDSEDYIMGHQETIINKAIKTRTPVMISKKVTLPYYGDVSSAMIIPIINKERTIGIIYLIGGTYDLSQVRDLNRMLVVLRIHLDRQPDHKEKPITAKDLFLANMSHEIRTPLNGVIGYVQLLMQTNTTETQRHYITAINKCSLNLAQIINDILDFSKLISGKMKLSPTICKITDIINFVQETLTPKIQEKHHSLIVKIPSNIPEYITIDKQKVIQILMNLLSNAIKFTPLNGVITITVTNNIQNTLHFSVKDTGVGISREDQNKLFRTFTQLDNSLSRSYDGSGLGLAISKKLVELLKGEISLRSVPDQGSEFFFTVKYEHMASSISSLKPMLFKNKSILIAFESTDQRIAMSDMLLGWGLRPTPCSSSIEAKKLLSSFAYDFEICIVGLNDGLIDMIKENYPLMPVIDIDQQHRKSDYQLRSTYNPIQLYDTLEKAITESRYIKKKDSLKVDKGQSILIAEDMPYNQDLLVSMLASLDYRNVKVVNDGIETVQSLKASKYDILLLDLKMPRMNGYQVLDYIKSNKIGIKVIPITASVLDEDQSRCQSYGVKHFLRKPIILSELRNALLM